MLCKLKLCYFLCFCSLKTWLVAAMWQKLQWPTSLAHLCIFLTAECLIFFQNQKQTGLIDITWEKFDFFLATVTGLGWTQLDFSHSSTCGCISDAFLALWWSSQQITQHTKSAVDGAIYWLKELLKVSILTGSCYCKLPKASHLIKTQHWLKNPHLR